LCCGYVPCNVHHCNDSSKVVLDCIQHTRMNYSVHSNNGNMMKYRGEQ
jgi:hypothetical protein